ncbi:hypothetical protein R3P38DRAFT_1214407 [Favolaschia claudopus]|uniref:Uncharacterized protein n=1 Tax=Favolaschia claudopus TaxID=2862362 RepID=A0AAW0B337_9AGAR
MRAHALFLASCALLVASQAATSNVTTCTPAYSWSINSKNQTPCLVAAFLESVCQGAVQVNSIPVGTHYRGPAPTNATLCLCSTPVYSLISACGGCQDRNFISWTEWAANCPQGWKLSRFLQAIPDEVVVPSWAYLDVTKTDNTFDPIIANLSLANSESTTLSPPSTALSTSRNRMQVL